MNVQEILLLEKNGWEVKSVSPIIIINKQTSKIIEDINEVLLIIKNIKNVAI
jgi:hypothetical protein